MNEYHMLINGKLVSGDMTMDVVNPSTEEILAQCPRASEAQLEQAIAAAKAAFPKWSAQPIDARRDVLNKMADRIEANADAIARILTQEQGKPIGHATTEVHGAVAYFRHFASLDLPVTIMEETSASRIELHHRPLGVVGAIVPWNFPIILLAFKLPPALLAGNTLVLKPAPTTPLATLKIAELIADLAPAGVVNIIADANELGSKLTAHPDIAKISFTGSTATGAKVMAGAASLIKRVTLELGGNDAGIVLDDVDPKEAAPQLFGAAFANSGQVCIAMKRLYVHESIYDEMCSELASLADAAIVGDGLQQGTEYGPLQNKGQFERVKDLIEDAREHGEIIAGGTVPDGKGFFIRPTIVRDISDGTRLVDEEQFGPVLPVIKYSDPEDAVSRANASPYGLGGSIWSKDLNKAYALAQKMDAGTVWVNKHLDISPQTPFGGAKQSGFGTEGGQIGLEEFTQLKVINVAL